MHTILWFSRGRYNPCPLLGRWIPAIFIGLAATATPGSILVAGSPNPKAPIENAKSKAKSEDSIHQVLMREANGEPVNRAQLLDGVKQEVAPNGTAGKNARWQSGQLHHNGDWVAMDALQLENDATIERYLKERGNAVLSAEDHRRLAKWCAQHELADRCRAHWYGVLDTQPNDVEARNALQFTLIDGHWIGKKQLDDARRSNQQNIVSLKTWMPKIRQWIAALDGNDSKKKVKAIEELRKVSDPKIVYALQFAAMQLNRDVGIHFVKAIHRFRSKEAATALTLVAIHDPSTPSGAEAITSLRDYPMEFFVPNLLEVMSTETELQHQLITRPNGDLILQQVQMREMKNDIEMNVFEKLIAVDNSGGMNVAQMAVQSLSFQSPRISGRYMATGVAPNNAIASEIARREAERIVRTTQENTDESNATLRAKQLRIVHVLETCTGKKFGNNARDWWEWWNDNSEVKQDGTKGYRGDYALDNSSPAYDIRPLPIVYVDVKRTYSSDQPKNVPSAPGPSAPSSPPPMRHSFPAPMFKLDCLAAESLIQTESGLVPIDKIRVGDLVVSQDVESGELSLKPVLRTSMRPVSPTKYLLFGDQGIRATLGHNWWVAGKGWVKTKDIEAGMLIHTSTGTVKIDSIEEDKPIDTFNLIVADTHTFFVGESRVLSYDGSELLPTFQAVPGLAPSLLAAK